MSVTNNRIREKDLELVNANQRDLENSNDEEGYKLVALDESQNIYVFDGFGGSVKQTKYKLTDSFNIPKEVAEKDLFGMGYPYFINLYQNYIAVTSDYGVILL